MFYSSSAVATLNTSGVRGSPPAPTPQPLITRQNVWCTGKQLTRMFRVTVPLRLATARRNPIWCFTGVSRLFQVCFAYVSALFRLV